MRRTLTDLKIGEIGYIYQLDADTPTIRRRLIDMGLIPYTAIEVKRIAPMGDPIELIIRGFRLSLRCEDAARIILMNDDEVAKQESEFLQAKTLRAQQYKTLLDKLPNTDRVDEYEHNRAASMTEKLLKFNIPCDINSSGVCPAQVSQDNAPVRLALVGNPNCGKTTLFNAMTGSREYVGNWPGVTVEKKEGIVRTKGSNSRRKCSSCNDGLCTMGHEMTLIDLPGIYSLSPHTMEEIVSRNYIIEEKPNAIINIVDGTNLERNLYLTVQLMELEVPMIIALNMMDEVERNGDTIDCKALSKQLGIPVIPISAKTGQGIDLLIESAQKLLTAAHIQIHEGFLIEPDHIYDEYTHYFHHRIGDVIAKKADAAGLKRHWAEIKALEGDALVLKALNLSDSEQASVSKISKEYTFGGLIHDNETAIANSRYSYIEAAVAASVKRRPVTSQSTSDKIDRVLTNKFVAIPLFILIMGLIFTLTFSTLGTWLSDLTASLIENGLTPLIRSGLAAISSPSWFISLICDGVISGVGGVLTFLPQIALLFFFLSLLEDSGYMSRIAFIMDKPMRRFGLSGKSFIPLLMGFGCTVPATMGARTMENIHDKRMTILLLPFMSCSAKLPVYGLIAGAFFGRSAGMVVLCLYLLGIIVGILTGLLFKKTLFKGVDAHFLIELPPYRLPSIKNTLLNVWDKVKHFIEKAGTIIFAMSVLLWFLMSFDFSFNMVENSAESIIGIIGGTIAPIFTINGFGFWQAAVALITGLVAKEAVVSSLAIFFGFAIDAANTDVLAAMSGSFSPLSAFSFLVFVLLYTPCIAAVTTMRNELGSAKHTVFAVLYQIGIAYLVSALIYQIGSLVFGL